MIDLTDIFKVYKMGDTEVYALNGVSLEIKEKEFVSIIGPSGSRKIYSYEYNRMFGCSDKWNVFNRWN